MPSLDFVFRRGAARADETVSQRKMRRRQAMRQLFPPVANTVARFSIIGGILAVVVLVFTLGLLDRSPYKTQVNVPVEQPVPFSHEHHVGQLGIDCRYCHTSVETSSFANVPSTDICMTCHSQLYTDS